MMLRFMLTNSIGYPGEEEGKEEEEETRKLTWSKIRHRCWRNISYKTWLALEKCFLKHELMLDEEEARVCQRSQCGASCVMTSSMSSTQSIIVIKEQFRAPHMSSGLGARHCKLFGEVEFSRRRHWEGKHLAATLGSAHRIEDFLASCV